MKTYRFYIMTLALTFLFAGCSEDELTKGPGAKVGDEVQFGLSLSNLGTRTVYGEEYRDENTKTDKFPIYWVNGDKVRVASPQCLSGRNSAEYQIAVDGATQNYATNMTKTGDYGVQWGDAATADFYSIYPSSASTKLEVKNGAVETTLHVDATQFASTTDKGTSYYAQPAEMGNVVMYAKSTASKTDPAVELRYTPFSTVLEFEINAPSTNTGSEKSEITIQSLTLTAPEGTTIAGDFGFTFPAGESTTPSITPATTGGSNDITLHFLNNNQYTTVLSTTKTTLKAKMCLMPISGVESILGWKIEVNTSAGTFSKTIKDTDLTDRNTALAPGMVHKIKLPKLNYASQEWVYSLNNWIPSLPDYTNIYLSELSLPGAWYTGSTESYQKNSDVPTLWDKGVRAFAVECRSYSTGEYAAPSRICISGSGGKAGDAYSDYVGWNGHDAIHISTLIKDICDKLASQTDVSKQEYAVLVLSYADGGDGGHRDVDHDYFLNGIDNEITQSGVDRKYIFGSNGETLSKNTTVDDVKGKLIIKVNMDSDTYGTRSGQYQNGTEWFRPTYANYSYAYGNNLNSAISYTPFLKTVGSGNYAHPCYSNMYWKEWSDDYKHFGLVSQLNGNEKSDRFIWVFSSANRTHADVTDGSTYDIPTYADRKEALGAMMKYSTQIYNASTHNVWFYFNCGGTQATSSTSKNPSPTDFAKTMNSWLLNTINAKTDPSPLGIVMFNQCTNTDYNGPAIVDAIIKMNSKFYLKHAGTSGGSTGGDATPTAEIKSLSETHDSGMEDSGENAIHW